MVLRIDDPSWATDSINTKGVKSVIAIDDDPSVLKKWRDKVAERSGAPLAFCAYENRVSSFPRFQDSTIAHVFHSIELLLLELELDTVDVD